MGSKRSNRPRPIGSQKMAGRRLFITGSVALAATLLVVSFAFAWVRPARAVRSAQECPATKPAQNIALVSRWYDQVWNKGESTAIAELLADDVVQHVGNRSDTGSGGIAKAEAIVREQRFVDYPDLTVTVDNILADRDLVVARLTWAGTHTDDLEQYVGFNTAPTFRRIVFGGTSAFRIGCGKIVEEWVSSDVLGLLQQIGAIPMPGVPYGPVSARSEVTAAPATCAAGPSSSPETVVDRLYADVLNRHDLSAVPAIHTSDTAFHGSGGPPLIGDLAQTSLYAEWFQAHPDLRLTMEETIVQGDQVGVLWTAEGSQVGSYTGAGTHPGTGRKVTFAGITIYRLACGQIAETWEHFNNLDLYRQIVDGGVATPSAT